MTGPDTALDTYGQEDESLVASRGRRLSWVAAGVSLPLLYLAAFNNSYHRVEAVSIDRAMMGISPALNRLFPVGQPETVSARFADTATVSGEADKAITLRVRRGDTLETLFRREGLSSYDLAEVMKLDAARRSLHMLRPGDEIQVHRRSSGDIIGISRDLDAFSTLQIDRQGGVFEARVVPLPYDTQRVDASGRISSSLFEAGTEAGISDAAVMKLASIFASDVDFVLDIREGDQFAIIYDQYWRNGRKVGEGDILAAEFVNQGVRYRAVRYKDPDGRVGYYTPEGKSLHKAFVRAPLAFSRISSDFNPRRMHPILHTIRAHQGTDYAAPAGTPVRAPGDGKVIFRGQKGGYGNVIMLQHAGNITTVYGHLSSFAKITREGQAISQGEVIGYVGMTGLATAPHLHYEYRINGVPVNSRTVKLPDASPVSVALRVDFLRAAAPLLQRLDARGSLVAGSGLKSRHNG